MGPFPQVSFPDPIYSQLLAVLTLDVALMLIQLLLLDQTVAALLCHFTHKKGTTCCRWLTYLLLFSVAAFVPVAACTWVCWAQAMVVGRHVLLLHCRSQCRLGLHPVGLSEVKMPLVLLAACCPVLRQNILLAPAVPALLCAVVLSAQVVVFVGAAGIAAHCLGRSPFGAAAS